MEYNKRICAPDVYLPIEISTREYAGHLLLAARLVDLGLNVVIGHREPVRDLMRSATRPGVLYFKGGGERNFGRPDFAIVGQDPEMGIVYADYADFVKSRPQSLQQLSTSAAYFTYGQFDYAHLLRTNPELAPVLHQTGSPRTMLWGRQGTVFYRQQVEEVRNQYGAFALLVSSGGAGNRYLVRERRRTHIRRGRHRFASDALREYEQRRDRLLAVGKELHYNTGLDIVVRPHPAEDWAFWWRVASTNAGFHVDSAYDLGVWVRAASLVVQTGSSTSAFESWIANTPTVSDTVSDEYRGRDGSETRLVPSRLTLDYESCRHGKNCLEDLSRKWEALRNDQALHDLVSHRLSSPPLDATVRIANVIRDLVSPDIPSGVRTERGAWRRPSLISEKSLRTKNREFLGRVSRPPFKRWNLEFARVESDISRACEMLGIINQVALTEALPNAFVLRPR